MPDSPLNERELFEQALDFPPEERAAFLARAAATGADPALLQRVQELLAIDARAGRFLGRTDLAPEVTVPDALPAGPRLDRYLLLDVLGEGGFGVVHRAEQIEPVRRQVALKLLRPGLESRRIAARFEAERQLLAQMNHPCIARALDAGTAADGRPFLVMELVPGAPLTRFCDDARLTVRERIELFLEVCGALQHAHQKGVIHRDLKPSNVLVARADDGRAQPKVIDFGVAKAMQTEAEGLAGGDTRLFELLGTPAYMSPEQAGFDGRDADVRADIYSLGVLLHELLLGCTPQSGDEPARLGIDAWRKRLCDEEAPRLTARWRALPAPDQAAVAAARRASPASLARLLARDLEWIVARCLEKDRERRYPSVAALAADLRRHLDDQPVEAAAPGPGYRLGKFVRRHRIAVTTAALMVMTLAAATVVSLTLAWRATRAEQRAGHLLEQEQRSRAELERVSRLARDEAATAQAVARFLNEDVLGFADPAREPEREITLRAVLDRASLQLASRLTNEPAVTAALHETLGRAYQNLAVPDQAVRHYDAARALFTASRGSNAVETLRTTIDAAFARFRAGDSSNALAAAEAAAARTRRHLGRTHPLSIHAGHRLAWIYYGVSRLPDWHREAEDTFQDLQGIDRIDDGDLLGVMYLVARKRGAARGGVFEAGEQILLHAAGLMQERRGPEDSLTQRARTMLAVYYYDHWRNVDRAESLFLEGLEWQRRTLGEAHESTLMTLRNLGLLHRRADRHAAAQHMYLRVLAVQPGDATALGALPGLVDDSPLPALPGTPTELRFRGTTNEPPADWTASQFNDRAWIADDGSPRRTGCWRAEFVLSNPPPNPPVFQIRGVRHGELFVNGVSAGPELSGQRIRWWIVLSPAATRSLRAGRNVVALRVDETAPAREWQMTLHAMPEAPESPDRRTPKQN